jgi:hypothetical protein
MATAIADLQLTPDKLAQFATALGDAGNANAGMLTLCAQADADVARLTAGYLLDATSLTNFSRTIVLFRAYGFAGPVPEDIDKQYTAVMNELQSIARGDRPNLPKVTDVNLQSRAGAAGSARRVHGRMRSGFGGEGGQI